MSTQTSVAPGPILSTALALSVFAAIVSLSGTLLKAPAAMTPFLIWTPILLSVAAYLRSGRVRSYLLSVPMSWIFIVQAIRAPVGIFFLIQESRGTLPASLAATAGWGDLLFGGVSALLLWKPSGSRTVLILWNTIGLLEILAVIASAMRLIVFANDDQGVRSVMTAFPTALIPLVLVPFVVAAHFLVFARLNHMTSSIKP
ncbi:MAG: hypothetical protein JKY56_08685 [Kofleriaceae bacterium]|nr:hypothetical protein [Kofleriaceae bacterium]